MADPGSSAGAAGRGPAAAPPVAPLRDGQLLGGVAGQDGQMQFLCDLCERLIGQLTVLTDRYEEERQRTAVLQAEADAERNAVRHWRRRCQELEAQIEVDADVLQHANTSLALHKRDLESRLAAAEDDRKELLYAAEKRHRREMADLRDRYEQDLAILKSIRRNEALLVPGTHQPRPGKSRHSCSRPPPDSGRSPPRLCQAAHAAQLACLPPRTRSPPTRRRSPPPPHCGGEDWTHSTSGPAHRSRSRRRQPS